MADLWWTEEDESQFDFPKGVGGFPIMGKRRATSSSVSGSSSTLSPQ